MVARSGQSDTTRPRGSFQAVCPGAGWAQKRDIEKPPSGGRVVQGGHSTPLGNWGCRGSVPARRLELAVLTTRSLSWHRWCGRPPTGWAAPSTPAATCGFGAARGAAPSSSSATTPSSKCAGSRPHHAVPRCAGCRAGAMLLSSLPRGNWIGEAPYKVGRPCSACPPSYGGVCSNNMCFTGLKSNQVGWL